MEYDFDKDVLKTSLFIAHIRQADKSEQSVATHLTEIAAIARELAAKLGLSEAGELLGMCISGGVLLVICFCFITFN